jgi:hypothetical protein
VLSDEERATIKSHLVRSEVKEALRLPRVKYARVDGFYRSSNWWQHNRTLARCVRHILNCNESSSTVQKGGRHLCVERAALQLFAGHGPGLGMKPFASSIAARVVGISSGERDMIRKYLSGETGEQRQRPLFDASIHLRLQVRY